MKISKPMVTNIIYILDSRGCLNEVIHPKLKNYFDGEMLNISTGHHCYNTHTHTQR